MSHYSAAKAAIIGLTQSLAYELAGDSINVNCICPGITENTGVWDNVSAGYVENPNMPMDKIVEKFVAIGGVTKNEFWMQNKADMIGKPIETPAIEEPTPLGAAILAGIGVGLYRDVRDAYEKVYKPGKTYQPNLDLTEKYRRWFKTFEQIYPSLKKLNAQLRTFST